MTTRSEAFVEHSILQLDASRGITYQTFDEFWRIRMEPMQFIAPNAKGTLAAVRDAMIARAREQWELFQKTKPAPQVIIAQEAPDV